MTYVELFDPLNQSAGAAAGATDKGGAGSTAVLEAKQEDGLEEVIKQLEKKVNQLLEDSAIANCNGKFQVVRMYTYNIWFVYLYTHVRMTYICTYVHVCTRMQWLSNHIIEDMYGQTPLSGHFVDSRH